MSQKRNLYTFRGEGSQRWYKVNLPVYLSEDMVKGLVRETGKSERFVIDRILGDVSHQAEGKLGHGAVIRDWMSVYVDEDGDITHGWAGDDDLSGDIPSGIPTWAYPQHVRFGKIRCSKFR